MLYPKLVESKISANEIKHIEWNPGMDLLATVFGDGSLVCSRLLSLQKVWQKPASGKIKLVAWRPDGRVLAYSGWDDLVEECCHLHDVENGEELNEVSQFSAITSVSWFQYSPSNVEEKQSKEDPIRLKKSIEIDGEEFKKSFSHKLAHEQTSLNILLISTIEGIGLYCLGLFCLGNLVVHPREPNFEIIKTHMSSCMSYITSVICNKQANTSTYSIKILTLDTLNKRSNEILRLSKLFAKIKDELLYLKDIVEFITTSWADVLAGLDNKLSSYCSRKNKNPDESQSEYTFLSADELLQLLVIGFTSDNLEKFLADMSDKGLKKLNNAIEQTCLRVQSLIVKDAQKCCYHLHSDLNLLRGMAVWKDRYGKIGISDTLVVDAMRAVGSLLLKLTELQQVIDHSLKSTKSFFRWLISIACRLTGEQNNSVVPNDINKTTQQDIQLITDFILENFDYNTSETDTLDFSNMALRTFNESDSKANHDSFANRPTCSNFTLEQVGQYLKNEPLSRLKYSFAKPDSNFWIEFFKKRPELTEIKHDEDGSKMLLFYPHNPETSMIQEYKTTSSAISKVFSSIPEGFLANHEGDRITEFIDIKDFIKNVPSNRIRIETDTNKMQHYTLFQTKPSPTAKQYLLVLSLEDKSFKVFSIRFQAKATSRTISAAQNSKDLNLTISDSSFYENKDSKKLLLSFLLLDTAMNDTLIVQVELDNLLDNYNSPFRRHKDISKIFRSDETIDKQSVQVILNLDIYTEPAQDRKFEQGIMVKKIKSTVGRDMFSNSGRGVIAFTSCSNKRLHLYELETVTGELEVVDDEVEGGEKIDESLIDTDVVG